MPARFELSISTPDLEREWSCSMPAQVYAVLAHYRELMEEILVIEYVDGVMYGAMGTDWYTMNITGYTCPSDAPWLYPEPVDWTEALGHVDMEPSFMYEEDDDSPPNESYISFEGGPSAD